MIWIVRVRQLVVQLTDPEDKITLPAGARGFGSCSFYEVPGKTRSQALEWFHEHIAIGCLDDFEILAKRKRN